jgi:hypothetical protein
MSRPTRKQMMAFREVYLRDARIVPASYLAYRRTIQMAFGDCYMIPWCGMFLGVEPDGYTHS